jgi:hypothetical protein
MCELTRHGMVGGTAWARHGLGMGICELDLRMPVGAKIDLFCKTFKPNLALTQLQIK